MDEQKNEYLPDANTLEEINRDSKNDYKDKKRKRRIKFAIIAVVAGIILFCVIIVVTAGLFFRIENITVEGNVSYGEEFLLNTMGVKAGDSIFLADQKEYAKKLSGVCPMVFSVRVDKDYPNSITIVITEEKPSYKFKTDGIWSVVSKSGKVLYTGEDLTGFDGGDELIEIIPPPVLESVMGYGIRYVNQSDSKAVPEVVEAIERSDLKGKIVHITMNSRFDIRLQYLDRFEILLGNREDISVKLKFAEKIIAELKDGDTGKIDVKDAKEGYAILD